MARRGLGHIALLASLMLGACAQGQGGANSNAGTGAVIGGIAGAVLGNVVSAKGARTENTVIGAAVGAAVGGGVGHLFDKQQQEFEQQLASERRQHEVEIERVRDDLLKLTVDSEVSFDFDSSRIKPSFGPTLEKIADVLVQYDQSDATIVGYTDSVGDESYNQTLSERRALAVRDELVIYGVPGFRMSTEGRGEREPRADNNTDAGRQLNRRVEILVRSTA